MPDQKKNVIERDILLMYKKAHEGVPAGYDVESPQGKRYKEIEEQSAVFLKNYVLGKAVIDDGDLNILKDYLRVLKSSSYPDIKKYLSKAEKILAIHLNKQLEKASSQSKGDQNMADYLLRILPNKREMNKRSSTDLLHLAAMLDKVKTDKPIREVSIRRLENMLQGYIQTKIAKTFSGELGADDNFNLLVQERGSPLQKNRLRRSIVSTQREDSSIGSSLLDGDKKNDVVDNKSHIDVIPLALDSNSSDSVGSGKPKKSQSFDFPHDKERMEFLRKNQFAILHNKKKAQKLTAIDYLLIAEMINEEKGYSTKDVFDRLRGYAQLRINNVLSGKLPYEPGFDLLVSSQGTTTQKTDFDRRRSTLEEKANDRPATNTSDGKSRVEADVLHKLPWYKRWWKIAAAALVGAVAIFGLAKAPNFFKNSSKDKVSPQTEQNDKTPLATQAVKPEKSIDFTEAMKNLQKNQAKIAATSVSQKENQAEIAAASASQKVSVRQATTASTPTNKLDADWNRRVDIFKKAQDKLHINLDNLDKVVNAQVNAGNIVLSEKLTEARAKYMISFYAQYPYSEAGQVCNALLNGENVDVSKEDFNKWNDELGDKGTKFIKTLKNNGYTTTTFSPSDYVWHTTSTRDI